MSQKVTALEQEIERLTDGAELENVSLLHTHTAQITNLAFLLRLTAIFTCVWLGHKYL